jgi:hypothetical protein
MAAKQLSSAEMEVTVARIAELVAEHGALPANELKAVRRFLPQLKAALEARQLEVTKQVRKPLFAQVESGLRERPLAVAELVKCVFGASAAEVKLGLIAC